MSKIVRPLQRGSDAAVDEFLDAIGATVVAVDADWLGKRRSCAHATARCACPTRCRSRRLWRAPRSC